MIDHTLKQFISFRRKFNESKDDLFILNLTIMRSLSLFTQNGLSSLHLYDIILVINNESHSIK